MSAPRRRRWMDVLRRTAGDDAGLRKPLGALDDAALWSAHEAAGSSLEESSALAERVAAQTARQRVSVEGAAERASLVAARSEGLVAGAARVREAFERLGVVALNAGLEGARLAEPQGRALLLVSDEVRANVTRGAETARELSAMVEEIAGEAGEVRKLLERMRGEATEVGQESAKLKAAAQQAHKSLDDLGQRLRKATGMDPELARVVASAAEHARGLMTALSALSTSSNTAPVLLGALRPVIGPLMRLLGEISDEEARGDDGASDGGDAP